MPGWIRIANGIVEGVAVAVEGLWIVQVWYNAVRLGEVVKIRRVESCAIVIDPQASHLALTGEQLIGIHRPCAETCLAVGIISLLANDYTG